MAGKLYLGKTEITPIIHNVDVFSGINATFEIHFPLAIKEQVEALPGYATKWGAKNATVVFDL